MRILPTHWWHRGVRCPPNTLESLTGYGNYRPIFCIPHVSKILVKAINQQLKVCMLYHEFITGDQPASRSGNSTETAIQRVMIDLLDGANDGLKSGMCFSDLANFFWYNWSRHIAVKARKAWCKRKRRTASNLTWKIQVNCPYRLCPIEIPTCNQRRSPRFNFWAPYYFSYLWTIFLRV